MEDASGAPHFRDLPLEGLEYTRGSGWAPSSAGSAERAALSAFVYSQDSKFIRVTVQLK